MTVYVDDMNAPFRRMVMCHMVADTEDELHAMARRIGVARKWYQGDHYDICLSRKALAIHYGARPITYRQCGLMVSNRKATGTLGEPETAEAVFRQRWRHTQAAIQEQVNAQRD